MQIIPLKDDYVKLLPDEGKILLCKLTNGTHTEAIIKEDEVKHFTEVPIQ